MTRPDYLAHLRTAIQATHGVESRHVESVPVKEVFKGKIVWDGDVEVFDILGHAKAKRCFAWGYQEHGQNHAVAVLEIPPVVSPETAVKAAIVAEGRKLRNN
jgi:hypothetical protein